HQHGEINPDDRGQSHPKGRLSRRMTGRRHFAVQAKVRHHSPPARSPIRLHRLPIPAVPDKALSHPPPCPSASPCPPCCAFDLEPPASEAQDQPRIIHHPLHRPRV